MSAEFPKLKPNVVLAIGAHPDDMDVTSSGTLAKYASGGAKVYYLVVTDGGSGTSDREIDPDKLKAMRKEEQSRAVRAIKAEDPIFLDFPDGCLEVNMKLKKAIVRVIRQVKPDVVISMDPLNYYSLDRGMINHPDHRAVGEATLGAVFPLARDHLAFADLLKEGLDVHKVTTVLLTCFENCNYYEDITDFVNQKMEAIKAHDSQFGDAELVGTNITNWNKANGKLAGCEYAESFKRIDLAY